ncbi:hypothetical protein [Modestobacter sp. NPDC049651]|uniref:hypothetical protein n=1 Tax=unclassified Modestobacter TaxID=2643866 RepID=UPI0033CB1B61
MLTRVADGRARVVREIRAAAPLVAALASPVTARGPWLTAALPPPSAGPLHRAHPRAVVVERELSGRPDGLALLTTRRRGPVTAVGLLGTAPAPLPAGRPTARLHARDDAVASRLAEGLHDLLTSLRGPWTLHLTGLPLGDPTVRALSARLSAARIPPAHSTDRSRVLVDELDQVADVRRTRDPATVDRWLPAVLDRLPRPQRAFVRTAVRVHAALGELELGVVPRGDGVAAAVLTFVDGADRWPWWGVSDLGGLRAELGMPLVSLSASAGLTGGVSDAVWWAAGKLTGRGVSGAAAAG